MGCDIHAHIEIKVNGEWKHYHAPDFERDYAMFDRMAGVRGDGENMIVAPKGLPDDLSVITQICREDWGADAHTESWFNVRELKVFEDYLQEDQDIYYSSKISHIYGWLFGNRYGGLAEYRHEYPPEIEDVRMVFWFDN